MLGNDGTVKNSNEVDDSDDPVVEIFKISGSEYVKKSQIERIDIKNMVVRCTTCLHQLNHHDRKELRKHRVLDVLVCKECFDFYGSGEFSQDESGNYNYCAWCGNGGKLFLCDFCPNVFCSTCVRRNFGRREVSLMSKEGWKCYRCNPQKLKAKVAFCNLILEYSANIKKRSDKKHATESVLRSNAAHITCSETQDWVLPVFDQFDESCKTFHRRLEKLKDIGISQSKSLKHVIKKMEEIVVFHKTELSQTLKSLCNQYNMYIQNKIKAEEKLKKIAVNENKTNGDMDVNGSIQVEASSNPEIINLINNSESDEGITKVSQDENSKIKLDKKSTIEVDKNITIEPDEKNTVETDEKSTVETDEKSTVEANEKSTVETNEKCTVETNEKSTVKTDENTASHAANASNKNDDFNYQAKMSLLKESSDSNDSDLGEGPTKLENTINSKKKKQSHMSLNGHLSDTIEIKSDSSLDEINEVLRNEDIEDRDKEVEKDPDFDPSVEMSKEDSSPKAPSKTKNEKVSVELMNGKLDVSDSDSSSIEIPSDSEKTKSKKSQSRRPKTTKFVDLNDPKLKLQAMVVLDKCDYLLPNGETTIPVPASYKLADLDKEIKNLCKLPKKVIKKEGNKEKKPQTATRKKKVAGLEREEDSSEEEEEASSSSICLSSEDESGKEKKKNLKKVKDKDANKIAKEDLMASDSDESSSDATPSSEDEKPSKKKKPKSTKAHSDSSEDFLPRKKKKYDKLLHKRLLSDESGKENSKSKEDGEKKKQKKRRLANSDEDKSKKDSDSEHTTTSDSDSGSKQKRKKRRIKKRAASSSDSEGKEKDVDGSQNTPKKGRKDIKKILSKKDLTEETREAQLAERERRKRVQERQKLYNVIQEVAEGKETVIKKLVLEVDPVSKEEVVQIHPDLIEKLKPHQVEGVKFMWECTIESLKELEKGKGSGCILAHCMGLGKTLQVITFLHTCMTNPIVSKKIRTAMVICPYNTVLNWKREFEKWLDEVEGDITVHEMTIAKDNPMRLDILKYWQREGGVLILSYDIFRRLASPKIPRMTKKNREKIYELLIDPGADIVICDEGHVLKNVKSAISVACSKIGTERRIVLTGTPLQNNLMEYHCMLSFVKPHLLGTPKEFRNRFVNPIMNGQYDDSNEYDVKRMKKRIHILHKLLGGCVQRCDYAALTKFLPPKHEYVISVKLTETQIKMYRWYLDNLTTAKRDLKIRGGTLFQDYNVLRNLCTHPYIIHTSFQRAEQRRFMRDDDDEMEDFIADDTEDESKSDSSSSGEEVVKTHKTRSRANEGDQNGSEGGEEEEEKKQWYHEFISDENKNDPEFSGKMVLLVNILKECEAIGDKVVLFSQSLLTLDAIEDILENIDSQPVSEEDAKRDITCRWVKNVDYFRMDGTTTADFRKSFIDRFNNLSNDRARLFLVSTKAGGLGTNLVGANRVIMMDASWNPSHDVQAIFRAYRFGQVKPVYIYRLLAQGTMEEKIYDRQVTKLSLSIRVVDEQQIDRHFNAAELAELYRFEPEVSRDRPTPMLPADTLLAEMLRKLKDWIVTYHEHDSLLENKTEEDLTEEERQAAWNEYENEREGRGVATETVDIDEEIKLYMKEPDFGLADYVGSIIPSCKVIIEECIQRLKIKFPAATPVMLRRKLLLMIHNLRAMYQEKHVKVLRMKQEYVAKGSVPLVVNKYLDEINLVLKEMTKHYENISQLVVADAKAAETIRLAQMQQSQQNAQFRPQVNVPQYTQFNMTRPGFTSQFPRTAFVGTSFGVGYQPTTADQQQAFSAMLHRMQQARDARQYSSTSSAQAPVITEVVDESSTSIPTNSTSSVVIEEIE